MCPWFSVKVWSVTFLVFLLLSFCISCDKNQQLSTPASVSTPTLAPDNIETFFPPAIVGKVYIVTNKYQKQQNLYLSVSWGEWRREETIDVSNDNGVVLQLAYAQNDSVKFTIATDGYFSKSPFQGDVPEEWGNIQYIQVG